MAVNNDLMWQRWKNTVDAAVVRKIGLHADDLPDWDYRGAFEKGVLPHKAAAAAIRNAKKDMGQ